jgi:hypothetical protein
MSKGRIALGCFQTPGALVTARRAEAGPVAIVEAPLDAIALAQVGLPAVALFGASNRPAWLRRALAYRDCVIATDDDEAGNQAMESLRAWLDLSPRKVRLLFGGAKDASELFEKDPAALALLVEAAIQSSNPLHRVATIALEVVSNLDADASPEDGLSLLDYAGSVLGWHSHWPEARPSNWDELLPFSESVNSYPSLP